MTGREWAGSIAGRRSLVATIDRLGLTVTTAAAPHQLDGLLSIDHIAVPARWTTSVPRRYPATVRGARISDHDAYVVEAAAATLTQ